MHAYFGDKGGAKKLKKLLSEGKSHDKALKKAGKKMFKSDELNSRKLKKLPF